MASGPYFDRKTGAWTVQYFDGQWRRVVVMRKAHGWTKDKGRPKKIPLFATQELERYAAIEENARRVHSSGVPHRLDQFLEKHVSHYRNEKTRNSVDKTAKQFLAWCDSRDISTFNQVTTDLCVEWLEHLGKSLKVTTIRTRRAQLIGAWTKLCKRKGIPNPWIAAEVEGKPEIKKRGAWTKEEFDAILAVSRPWLKEVLIVGANTGLRINALMNLEWKHIERPNDANQKGFGYVVVPPELDKTGRGYRVPISAALATLLNEIEITTKREHIVAGQGGQKMRHSSGTGQAIIRACKRAGLKKPDSPNHHLRRTFGRWAVSGALTGTSVPTYYVSRWLGHTNIQTTMIYLDITDEDSTRFMIGEPE
jgi:integrase